MKVAVVYWSGTGNTAAMADAVAEGAKGAGADVNECMCMDFDQGSVAAYDALIFGCPAMGSEVLEEDDFGPMFEDRQITNVSGYKFGNDNFKGLTLTMAFFLF